MGISELNEWTAQPGAGQGGPEGARHVTGKTERSATRPSIGAWPLTAVVQLQLAFWCVLATPCLGFGPALLAFGGLKALGVTSPRFPEIVAALGSPVLTVFGAFVAAYAAKRIWPASRGYRILLLVLVALLESKVVGILWEHLGVAGDPLELESGAAFFMDQVKVIVSLGVATLTGFVVLRVASFQRWGLTGSLARNEA